MKSSTFIRSAVACAVAAAIGTGSAFASAPGTTPKWVVYAGGGSAEPQPVQASVCKLLTNVDSYTDASGGAASGDYLILYGTASANIGSNIKTGDSVMVIYKFNGGSYYNGAFPQAGSSGNNLTYPAVTTVLGTTAASTGLSAGSACATTNNGNPTYSYTAGATTSNLPDWGVSDLEPTAFTGFNIPSTITQVTVGAATPVYDLVEGVAVTNALYGVKSNFSRSEVSAILSGNVSDWSQLSGNNGSPLPAGGIILLDRNQGSGTKAAGTEYFLGYPAQIATGQYVQPNSVSNFISNAGYNAATPMSPSQTWQDVQLTSSSAVVADLKTANQAGLYAIAILSVDNAPYASQTSGVNNFDFVSIDGTAIDQATSTDNINGTVASSYLNAIKGSYDFYYQVSFNTRSSYLSGNSGNVDFANAMLTNLKSVSLAGVNTGSHFPLATPGIILDPFNTAFTKGVAISTRSGNSQAQLSLKETHVTIVPGSDPL